ncbi:MAG: carboxypeptidase regulatory-like domain-containing protein [Kofleriaceae bacterium]|nr:carboxypeptidase regulatory-like domain-containing protein [Kofleriaceae bacterium]
MRQAATSTVLVGIVLGARAAVAQPTGNACEHADATHPAQLEGRVVDHTTGQPLVGVTLVVTQTSQAGACTTISTADGEYRLFVPLGTLRLDLYYADQQVQHALTMRPGGARLDLKLELPAEGGFADEWTAAPPLRAPTHQEVEYERGADVLLALDHHGRAATTVTIGDDAVTTWAGWRRLSGGIAVPDVLVGSVVAGRFAPSGASTGPDGHLDLAPRFGSNQAAAQAQLRTSREPRLDLWAGGPLVHDRLWLSAGGVLARAPSAGGEVAAMAHVVAMPAGPQHQADLTALYLANDGQRDASVVASWRTHSPDGASDLVAVLGAERQESTAPNLGGHSTGGELAVQHRGELAGYHNLRLAIAGARGDGALAAERELSLVVADAWGWELVMARFATRWDHRRTNGRVSTALQPRAEVVVDWTKRRQGLAYFVLERSSTFDARPASSWPGDTTTDTGAAGMAYAPDVEEDLRFGVGVRHQRLGVDAGTSADAWMSFARHSTQLQLTAASLERSVGVEAWHHAALSTTWRLELALAAQTRADAVRWAGLAQGRFTRDRHSAAIGVEARGDEDDGRVSLIAEGTW